jgi:hypothetical protein
VTRAKLGLLFATAIAILIFYGLTSNDLTYRYRLNVIFDTPDGIKTGSAVHESRLTDGRETRYFGSLSGLGISMDAEAVFVDLGQGKNAVMTMASIQYAAPSVVGQTVTGPLPPMAAAIQSARQEGSVFSVPRIVTPPIITFGDVNKPETAKLIFSSKELDSTRALPGAPWGKRIIDFDNVPGVLGKGYQFREATLEFVSPGRWPFNLVTASWPEFLFGTPLSNEIRAHLPMLDAPGRPALTASDAVGFKPGWPEQLFETRF